MVNAVKSNLNSTFGELVSISVNELQRACQNLEVFVQGRPVGVIENDGGQYFFQYYPDCSDTDFVSLLMPVRARAYEGPSPGLLLPVFDMNLPEGSLRRLLVNRYSKLVQGFNDLALLSLVGQNTIGRLSFGAAGPSNVDTLSLNKLTEAKDIDALLAQLFTEQSVFSGVAGVQPKVLAVVDMGELDKVSDHQAAGQDLKTTFRGDEVIVKTGSAETPWIAVNEFYCLRAAHLSGLEVPEARLLKGGQVLAVERFDRQTQVLATQSLGAEDFCALSGLVSSQKYEGSYERAVKVLNNFVAPESLSNSRLAFFQALALSCVLRNGDAHLKNFTLLYQPQTTSNDVSVWYSPTYDVCTTNVYLSADMLALTMGGSKRYPTLKKLQEFGRQHCGLSAKEIGDVFERIHVGVQGAALELHAYGEVYPSFYEGVGRTMLGFWRAGLRAISCDLHWPGQQIK